MTYKAISTYIPLIAMMLLTSALPSLAIDLCKAVVVTPISPLEEPQSTEKQGSIVESITQLQIDKNTQEKYLCQHGGYCYPTQKLINNKSYEALHLLNCKIGRKLSDDGAFIYWSVDIIPDLIGKEELLQYEAWLKLLPIIQVNSDADNAAYSLVNKSGSECALLAKKALSGDVSSINRLRTSTSPCH